jgi:hypothetical protein
MKFRNLFNLVEDAQEVTTIFESVETPEQMVSALERLKKHPLEVLEILQSLRLSTEAVLEDALDPGGTIGEGDIPDDFEDSLMEEISNNNEGVANDEKAPEAPAAGK